MKCRFLISILAANAILGISTEAAELSKVDSGLFPVNMYDKGGTSVKSLFSSTPTQPLPKSTVAPSSTSGKQLFRESGITNPDFQCNLFANSNYTALLNAVTTLEQAIGPCNGTSPDTQSIASSGKTIIDSIASIRPILESQDKMTADQGTKIATSVDSAIRAATNIANSFATNENLQKACKQTSASGEIAIALNNIVNSLTPYAISAASVTGGTAAIPFIVGGSAVTGIISSITEIIHKNEVDIKDSQVRRAILENTCQYIKIDQKYRFLQLSRSDQLGKIKSEMDRDEKKMAQIRSSLSDDTRKLLENKKEISTRIDKIHIEKTTSETSFYIDKEFSSSTSDELKVCQLGLQLEAHSQDKDFYISRIINNLEQATLISGDTTTTKTKTLQSSAELALASLRQISSSPKIMTFDFSLCAKMTKSLIDTLDSAISTSNKLLQNAEKASHTPVENISEFKELRKQEAAMEEKKQLAGNLANSLENLRQYANSFSQSEIDSEIAKIRLGLFSNGRFGSSSPVQSWLDYTLKLHTSALDQYYKGIKSIQDRAYSLTESGGSSGFRSSQKIATDRNLGNSLATIDFQYIPEGSGTHREICRELGDVWNQWRYAVDHLVAYESLCLMIDDYIFDNRSTDSSIVQSCRGTTSAGGKRNSSKLETVKNKILKDKALDWAQAIKFRIEKIKCNI